MTTPRFGVVTDGGLDVYPTLHNDVPVAPFAVNFGSTTYRMTEITREELYRQLQTNPTHPTSAQPTPQDWMSAMQAPGTPEVLAVTTSAGLSGSHNSADQARQLLAGPGAPRVTLHDSGTLSAALAFQVHAAVTAAERGLGIEQAREWMRAVHAETELYFTIETLEYLRRGGRIGRVQAAVGGLLNLKPVVMVDKAAGTYTNAARARSYRGAIQALTEQVTRRFGEGTPLRVGLLFGDHPEDADAALAQLAARHPIVWSDRTGVNPVLSVHVGPRALGVAAAPGAWPWER
ncbi:DegV family protein [Deinococcus kurensis]|uniref:DegV family protein n=1 Tax=Deinococcus kurensis TaxID=2662757 RepID=UPI0012D2F1F1|nr:DegV family protein [Deinococcus kurensis]